MKAQAEQIGGGMAGTVITVNTNRVRPFAEQPREYFDAGELIALELSIKQRGQLQPAMVRRLEKNRDHDYELVDGQRRWHACSKLGVPLRAIIIDPTDPEDQFEISVAANFQRAEHTPIEIAKAIERMCSQGGRTEEYVATLFGKSGFWVNMKRNLINLVPEIQAQLEPMTPRERAVPTTLAEQLGRLPQHLQLPTLEEIKKRGLSSARASEKIRRILLDGAPERKQRHDQHGRNIEIFIRTTIQRADMTLDRMGPDDMRLLVGALVKQRKFDTFKESVMTAIGRLEVIHRRLLECRSSMQSEASAATPPHEEQLRSPATPKRSADASAAPTFIYSHPMKCPKCGAVGTRFRRWSNANLEKESWECLSKGCLLKISHYNIKVDRSYQAAAAAGG